MKLNIMMGILFKFMIFFVIFLIILEILAFLVIDRKKDLKKISGLRVNLFGLLMELEDFTILSLATLLIKYIFIIWSIFDSSSISIIHLAMLLIFSTLFGVFTKNITNIIFEIISSFALYYAMIASRILSSYLIEVRVVWYVEVGDIMLKLFIIIYSTFFLLRNINNTISRTRYIRRDRIEDN